MIIWTGYGFLTVLFVLAGLMVASAAGAGQAAIVAGLVVAAIVNFLVGRKINDPAKDQELIDPNTGEAVLLKSRSTLFFIPMQWWSIGIVGLAGYELTRFINLI